MATTIPLAVVQYNLDEINKVIKQSLHNLFMQDLVLLAATRKPENDEYKMVAYYIRALVTKLQSLDTFSAIDPAVAGLVVPVILSRRVTILQPEELLLCLERLFPFYHPDLAERMSVDGDYRKSLGNIINDHAGQLKEMGTMLTQVIGSDSKCPEGLEPSPARALLQRVDRRRDVGLAAAQNKPDLLTFEAGPNSMDVLHDVLLFAMTVVTSWTNYKWIDQVPAKK